MKRIALSIICTLTALCSYSQTTTQSFRELCQTTMHQSPFQAIGHRINGQKVTTGNSRQTATSRVVRKAQSEEEEFIFDPVGEEKMYVMTMYSYDQTNSKFVHAQSLKSQVRYDKDGKTVYFKDLCRSLNVITWVKGEKRVMDKDSLEVGIHKGDTIIDVPFGQPLVYYKSKYLVFFSPMRYNDSTGEMEAQDSYTLIQRGDSLVQPTLPDGTFQAAAGYVYISSTKQGNLSLDIDHAMRLERKPFVSIPEGLQPVEYVYSFVNSYGNIYKKKANVVKDGHDLYMQLSTSAPNAYVKGTLQGSDIHVESAQAITDSTFIYYYSLADPVLNGEELIDFLPTNECRLEYNEETRTIRSFYTGSKNTTVFSVDYLDGMDLCMDYISNPVLTIYPGDAPATPHAPIWRSLKLDSEVSSIMTYNYMSFVIPALDVDSNYINPSYLKYRVYINDSLYTFKPSVYMNLKQEMTDVPTTFSEGFDFYTYDQLHYVYLYLEQKDVTSIGIQSVYTVNGEERCSQIQWQRFDTSDDPNDTRFSHDLSVTSCRVKDILVKAGSNVLVRGQVTNNGKNDAKGFNMTCSTMGKSTTTAFPATLASGKSQYFELVVSADDNAKEGEPITISVAVSFADQTPEDNPSDNTQTVHYGIYTDSFTAPTLLLEEFTAESCGWCPYGAYRIHTAIEESGLQEKAIWVCHHEGFGVDWLTVDASTDYTALYGGNTFAPAWMLNRDQKYSDENYPVFGIGEIDEVKTTLTEALQNPCFVSLEAETEVQDSTLTVHVGLQKSELFNIQCPSARLSVFLVEDSIRSKKQKTYDSHTIPYHHNALREVLTDVWGNPIEWDGDAAEHVFTFQVPDTYNMNNLSVIAFVHEYNEDVNQRRLFNTTQTRVQITDAIHNIHSTLATDNCTYNLQGQKVDENYKGIVISHGKKYMVR